MLSRPPNTWPAWAFGIFGLRPIQAKHFLAAVDNPDAAQDVSALS
jgi:hypothetical protein